MKIYVGLRKDCLDEYPKYVACDEDGTYRWHNQVHSRARWSIAPRQGRPIEEYVLPNFKNDRAHYALGETEYRPGEYHPRIWRPAGTGSSVPIDESAASSGIQAVANLIVLFGDVARTVEPSVTNASVYGHKLRDLLVLACTEVEASWASVLRANGYPRGSKSWNRGDYVKLATVMRLSEWELRLSRYPEYPVVVPFRNWCPGAKLKWYDAYNAVKHDRESNFREATLENAIDALSASMVMLLSQYGPRRVGFESEMKLTRIRTTDPDLRLFESSRQPIWAPNEAYVPPIDGPDAWVSKSYTFS